MMKKTLFPILILLVVSIFVSACGNANQGKPPADSSENDLPTTRVEAPEENDIENSEAANESADVVFINGIILSMAPDGGIYQGLAIKENKILAVGETGEIESYVADSTQVIDLGGRTLMPGFIDTHQHLFDDGIIEGYDPLPNQQVAIETGITSIADLYVDENVLSQLVGWSNAGELRVRLNAYLVYTNNCGDVIGDWWKSYQPGQVLGSNLQVGGIKIFTDGGSCNIPAMSVEFPGGGFGDLFFTQEDLTGMISEVDDAGFQAAIHALGDRSLEVVLNAIEEALGGEKNLLRHRIEHNSTIRPDLLARYNETGAIPIIFGSYPTCIRTEGGGVYKYVLSSDYGEWEWPWRALMDANPGIKPAWHSDFLAFPNMSSLYHAWAMVTRKSIAEDGSICEPPDWLEAGALDIEEVLPMMTINAAYAVNREDEIGSLEAGKLADLVILSDNPLEVPADEIKDILVLMTMIDGKVEFCKAGSEDLCELNSATSIKDSAKTIPFGFLDSPAPGQNISGIFTIYGWALDDNRPIDRVEIYLDGELIGSASYGEPRLDVADAYPGREGSPNFGYSFQLDTTIYSNGPHTISAMAISSADAKAYMVPETVEFSIEN
jgi:predicted amidohydrolase YtcJ